MRIARILAPVTVLGPGRRAGLWAQGCTLACPGCASVDTWTTSGGIELSPGEVAERLLALITEQGLEGLTVTGGEPFQQSDDVLAVIAALRGGLGPDFDVLVFTGYTAAAADRLAPALAAAADCLVAGPYRRHLPTGGPLVASTNQEVVLRPGTHRHRYETWTAGSRRRLQVTADGGDLFLLGLPDGGDLERLATALQERGIAFDGMSWQA